MSFGGLSIRLLLISGCWKSIIEWKVPATNYRTSAGEAVELNLRPRKRRAHWCRPGCRRRCCPSSECHRPPSLTGKFLAIKLSVYGRVSGGLADSRWGARNRGGGSSTQILRYCPQSERLALPQIDEQGRLAVYRNSYKQLEFPNGA